MISSARSLPISVAGPHAAGPSSLIRAIAAAMLFALPGCLPPVLLTPNPRLSKSRPPAQQSPPAPQPAPAAPSADTIRAQPPLPPVDTIREESIALESPDLDFAVAFAESGSVGREATPPPPAAVGGQPATAPGSSPTTAGSQTVFRVPSRMIRVALRRNASRISLFSAGGVAIGSPGLQRPLPAQGRILVQAAKTPAAVRIDAGPNRSRQFALPCTLQSAEGRNFFELDDGRYRGSIVIEPQGGGRFMALNVVDVEDYLHGVIDLEIGARAPEETEAVKAQAIAARTYAYKRMVDRRTEAFDVLPTIDDQVYGGVAAESAQSERAVRETAGLVLAYGDSLINAYYHSTCGGATANVNDVWEKPAMPYLVSVRDADRSGTAYCSMSPNFRWVETWTPAQLSAVLARALDGRGCGGALIDIRIESRFDCGRVRSCRIATARGECRCGGDAVRYVLRRGDRERSILRSSNFSITAVNSREVRMTGCGYGHGVGMCQMGAVGRARAGQTCKEILAAYYQGSRIAQVKADDAPDSGR